MLKSPILSMLSKQHLIRSEKLSPGVIWEANLTECENLTVDLVCNGCPQDSTLSPHSVRTAAALVVSKFSHFVMPRRSSPITLVRLTSQPCDKEQLKYLKYSKKYVKKY